MNEIILKIVPVIFIAILGYILKRLRILTSDHGDVFLKLVYYISLPALILISIPSIELKPAFILLPLSSAIIILSIYFISKWLGKQLKLEPKTFGVLLVGTMIINNGFLLPFIIAAYGGEGLGRLLIFDLSNGILTFTFVYYLACRYGDNHHNRKVLIRKFLFSPPIWALLVSIALNLLHIKVHESFNALFKPLGDVTIPLLMISLGLYFKPKIVNAPAVIWGILIRMLGGFLIGYLLTLIFNIDGLSRTIVLISASAPIGYNSLTFASLENLDREYAASLVSFSILTGMILTPLLIFLLS